MPLSTRAPAKINLSLHIRGRRTDGFHELESLVAFAGCADILTLEPGCGLSLSVTGPTAELAGPSGDNLVLRAARALQDRKPSIETGAFRLIKRLPVAAGVGGGSSDAAAALRLLAMRNNLSQDDPAMMAAARQTGSDVPVCMEARARMMRGVGDTLGPLLHLPSLFAVLVNPGVAVETRLVFGELGFQRGEMRDGAEHPPVPEDLSFDDLIGLLRRTRNDMEGAARRIAPVIGEVVDALDALPGCRLARMSGSGATCFGLFADCHAAARAAAAIRLQHPGWWVKPTALH